jgi:SPP1 family predicted phage head-tail adaptor
MNPGKLRRRVEVYGKTKTINELNQTTYTDGLKTTIWAEIVPQTGNMQRQQAETILTSVTHKIIVRYNAGKDFKSSDYIKYKGRRFDIKFILNPFERNETLELFVTEVIDG